MKIEAIPVDAIVISDRHRIADPDVVSALAESIRTVGLLQPIRVYSPDDSVAHLVAGRHRLEAVRSLGWENIDAVFMTGDEVDRRLAEITENLHRAELTGIERAEQIAEWVRLTEQKLSAQNVQKGLGHRPRGGVSEAVRSLPLPGKNDNAKRVSAQRAILVADISSEAKAAAREAGIDGKQNKLLKVAQEPTPERQVAKVVELARPKSRNPVSPAPDPINDIEAKEKQVTRLMSAWNAASREAREEFLERIDRPVMDNRFG